MITFLLNGETISLDVEADTPLLWVLRDHLHLNGTKFGCGAGLCGACTVLLNEEATRSCVLPASAVNEQAVTTIEGLGDNHPVQQAWIRNSVPQCGYCQSGQIMSTVSLLNRTPDPDEQAIKTALAGNICRCGSYQDILRAVREAAGLLAGQTTLDEQETAS